MKTLTAVLKALLIHVKAGGISKNKKTPKINIGKLREEATAARRESNNQKYKH